MQKFLRWATANANFADIPVGVSCTLPSDMGMTKWPQVISRPSLSHSLTVYTLLTSA